MNKDYFKHIYYALQSQDSNIQKQLKRVIVSILELNIKLNNNIVKIEVLNNPLNEGEFKIDIPKMEQNEEKIYDSIQFLTGLSYESWDKFYAQSEITNNNITQCSNEKILNAVKLYTNLKIDILKSLLHDIIDDFKPYESKLNDSTIYTINLNELKDDIKRGVI